MRKRLLTFAFGFPSNPIIAIACRNWLLQITRSISQLIPFDLCGTCLLIDTNECWTVGWSDAELENCNHAIVALFGPNLATPELSIWIDPAELLLGGDLDSLFQFGVHFKPHKSSRQALTPRTLELEPSSPPHRSRCRLPGGSAPQTAFDNPDRPGSLHAAHCLQKSNRSSLLQAP